MKVLVTGASGFVGANLTRLLLAQGHSVRALLRPTSDLRNVQGLNVEKCLGDLRDLASIEKAVQGVDRIFHVAAEYTFWTRDIDAVYKSNIEGTRNILYAGHRAGVEKIVYTSTVGTIGLKDQPKPCNENTAMHPKQLTSHYKRSKLEAEKVALQAASEGVPVVIVNPSAPVGPWDAKPTPTGKMILDFLNRKMPAYLESGLNVIHVEDVCNGHILAAEKGKIGERYILGHQNLSLSEIFQTLSEVSGLPAPKFKIPYALAYGVGLADTWIADKITHRPPRVAVEAVKMARRHMYFDSAKALRELGLPQTPVKKALADAAEWFLRNGYLKNKVKLSNIIAS